MSSKHKLLILDVDETLIHATEYPKDDYWEFEVGEYKIYKRPFLTTFLKKVHQEFRVAIWSSASEYFIDEVVKEILPKGVSLEFVWARMKCTPWYDRDYGSYEKMVYCKNLKKVAKANYAKLSDILIVDDTPQKVRNNYGNAIYPNPFFGSQTDRELEMLLQYLLKIKDAPNFRNFEKRDWKSQI